MINSSSQVKFSRRIECFVLNRNERHPGFMSYYKIKRFKKTIVETTVILYEELPLMGIQLKKTNAEIEGKVVISFFC